MNSDYITNSKSGQSNSSGTTISADGFSEENSYKTEYVSSKNSESCEHKSEISEMHHHDNDYCEGMTINSELSSEKYHKTGLRRSCSTKSLDTVSPANSVFKRRTNHTNQRGLKAYENFEFLPDYWIYQSHKDFHISFGDPNSDDSDSNDLDINDLDNDDSDIHDKSTIYSETEIPLNNHA